MKKIITLVAVLSFFSLSAQIGTGTIKGTLLDNDNAEPIPFANVTLLVDSITILESTTDFDGKYTLKPIKPGTYDLQFSYVGYQTKKIAGIFVKANRIVQQNAKLSGGVELSAVDIVAYKKPLYEKDQTTSGTTTTRKEIERMAVRSVSNIAKTTGNGIFSRDKGSRRIKVRGQRTGGSVTFIDGVKVIGSTSLPRTSIEEVSVKTPGVSAQYENANASPKERALFKKAESRTIKKDKTEIKNAVAEQKIIYEQEFYQEIIDNAFESAEVVPLSTFSIDVDKASYANTRRYINDGYLPPVSAVRIEEMINYFDYDYPQPEGEHPFSITTEYSDCPWNDQRKLALIGIQGQNMEMESSPKSNLVFLIDVSGSMASSDKLGLLKEGFKLLVDQLRDEDRVAIVVYAGAAGLVLPSTSGKNKKEIRRVIDNLSAGGSTAGGQGIQLAYRVAQKHFKKEGNNRVILATDGDFNVGVSDQKELVKLIEGERDKGIFLSVLGFGTGNLQDYKMEQIADKGNGNYNYIDNILEAKKVLINEMSGTLFTIAKDVKVQAEFNPAKVKAYRLIGYVNRHLEDEDFNDDTKDAGELGAGHSVTVLYEIIPAESEEVIPEVNNIDPLKYKLKSAVKVEYGEEVLTVKFRYKKPDGEKSILLSKAMLDEKVELQNASPNLQFSAAVASFGMLLRESKSVENLEFKDVAQMAKRSKGSDDEGYRSEFIRLVETAQLLK